VSVVT